MSDGGQSQCIALPVDDVARDAGFGPASVLRHHVGTALQTTARAHRGRFSLTPAS